MNIVFLSGAIDFLRKDNTDRRFWAVEQLQHRVRVRVSSPDPFHGLRGHAYIRARGLTRLVRIKGMPIPEGECQCAPCVQQRMLPAVLQICAAREHHMIDTPHPQWNNPHDDAAHELLSALEF